MNSIRMDATARAVIELEIAGAAVCWEPALKVALDILPVDAIEDEMARVSFYWAAGQSDLHRFDGVTNPDRLCAAMERAQWPHGWTWGEREHFTESLWTPRMYDNATIRSLCEALRDEHAAWGQLVRVRKDYDANRVIQRLLRESVPPPTGRAWRPPDKEGGIMGAFKR